jgi:formiminotetrahydrofolate cyclodeaminase
MLTNKSLQDFLAALASPDPTPGGGSAAAVASAMGASLLIMVSALSKTKSGSDADRTALAAARAALTALQRQLTDAIAADTAAYDRVVAAYKLPKTTESEQNERKAAIQRGLRAATDVPLGVVRLSALALDQSQVVAEHGHSAARSDVGVAIALLRAGLAGARLNVDINLASVKDPSYVDDVRLEVDRVAESAGAAADSAERLLQ